MSSGSGKNPRGRLGGSLVVLVAALALAVPLAWATHTFDDVPDASPHHADVTGLKGAGITAGCNPPTNNLYCPDSAVRRDQMATFLRRGLGRVARAFGPTDNAIGSGVGLGPLVDLASLSISVPGASGTQFVFLTGEASLLTNSTKAAACAAATFCNLLLYLYDGGTQLARAVLSISGDQAGATVDVSAVQAVAAGTTKTYTLRAQAQNVNTGLGNAHQPRVIATTFPFGSTGGAVLSDDAAPTPSAGPDLVTGG